MPGRSHLQSRRWKPGDVMLMHVPARFRASYPAPSMVRTTTRAWHSIAAAELIVRFRDANVPVLLAFIAAACVLLTPPVDASYAVITFGGMKPIMSAGTSIAAAGAVFGILMFPVYVLGLGLGCTRDRRLGTGLILSTSPVDPAGICCARLLANAAMVMLFSLLVLALVLVVIVSRFGSLPDPGSVLAYLLLVIPAGLCSLPVAALADRYLGDRDGAKAGVAFTVWIALMMCSLLAEPDAFGLTLLRQNAPAGTGGDVTVGIIAAERMGTVPWNVLDLPASFVTTRLWLVLGAVAACVVACVVVRPGMLNALTRRSVHGSAAAMIAARPHSSLLRIQPAPIGMYKAAFLLLGRWLMRAKWIWAVIASALAIGIASPDSPRVALGLALMIPLLIVNSRRLGGEAAVRCFEGTIPALCRPSPLLFTASVLALVTVVPAAPLLAQLPLERTLHIVIAMLAVALWLTWTCAGIGRRLLGISVYALVWYVACFSDIPPAADLLGIRGTALPSLGMALGLTVILGILLLRVDSYDYRAAQRA